MVEPEGDILSEVKDELVVFPGGKGQNTAADLIKDGRKGGKLNRNTLWIRDLTRKHAELAVRTIVMIMKESPDPHARLKAADMILNRAYGAVKKDVGDGDGSGNLIINVLTGVPRSIAPTITVDAEVVGEYER